MHNDVTNTYQQGFTLVELVLVLILIGVLSVGAVGLFSGSSNYSTFIAKDLLVSQSLLAQQVALGDTTNANPVSLRIENDSDQWIFSLVKNGAPAEIVSSVELSGNTLTIDGTLLGAGASRTINWTSDATIADGSHDFQFSGLNSFRVCISAQGFAYELEAGDACR